MAFKLCCGCSCLTRWTPNDEQDRKIEITGEFTILNNPVVDEAVDDFVCVIDGLPTGPIGMAGGDANFGPDTASTGLGYYGVNSQNIRLQRFCTYDPQVTGFAPLSPAGTYSFATTDAGPYGQPSTSLTPKVFLPVESPKQCKWDDYIHYQLVHSASSLVGTAPTTDTTMDVVFDRVYMERGRLICNKIKVWTYGGVKYSILFNDDIGWEPTAILGVPRSSFDFSHLTANPVLQVQTSLRDHLAGNSITSSTAPTLSNDFKSSNGLADGLIRPVVFPSTADTFTNESPLQMGRSLLTAVIAKFQGKFLDGQWTVDVNPLIDVNAATQHGYSVTSAAVSWEYTDEAIYPWVGSADVMEYTGAYADISNTDDTKGVFAVRGLLSSASLFDNYPVDGIYDIDPVIPVTGYTFEHFIAPAWVGTETRTYALRARTIFDGSLEDGYIDPETRYETNYSEYATRMTNTLNLWNRWSLTLKPEGPKYTHTMTAAQKSSYRSSTDPVSIVPTAGAAVTDSASGAPSGGFVNLSTVEGYSVISSPSPDTEFAVEFDALGAGTIVRKLI